MSELKFEVDGYEVLACFPEEANPSALRQVQQILLSCYLDQNTLVSFSEPEYTEEAKHVYLEN